MTNGDGTTRRGAVPGFAVMEAMVGTEPRLLRRGRGRVVRTEVGLVRGATLLLGVAIITLAASGIASAVVVNGRDRYPDQWDPRVTDLVAFVERERGLTFQHPVRIDFLDDAAFRDEVTDTEAPDAQGRAEIKSAEAMLRAVGLLSGPVDILAAGNELAGDGIVGLYDDEDERVLIRGEVVDDERRSTLVHELTHVLQDQSFDLGDYEDEERTSGELAAYTAVVEADASDVEDAWRETLPAAARESLAAAEEKSSPSTDFKGVPEVFIELLGFPYAFGPDFLQAVVDKDGVAGRNRLFTEPPTTEEQILLPDTYLSRQGAQEVKTPVLKDGEKAIQDSEDDFGMLSLLVMMGERIDFGVAWPAVNGWAGDAVVAFERAGTTCVRSEVVFDTVPQAERFGNAFAQWSKGRPATQARNDRSVLFESCDPGTAAAGGRADDHVSGIEGLALREGIVAGLQEEGIPPKVAACTADGLLARMTADRISAIDRVLTKDPRNKEAQLEIQRTVAEVIPGCR